MPSLARLPMLLLLAFSVLETASGAAAESSTLLLRPLASPAGPRSGQPHLCLAPDGDVLLTWVEAGEGDAAVLRLARLEGDVWSEPRAIAAGTDWFVNWADVPSLAVLGDGTLVAQWLHRSGEATYAYEVQMSFSRDGGRSWGSPVVPHRDGTPTEHGFVSMLPWARDEVLAVWLDGRETLEAEPAADGARALAKRSPGAAKGGRPGDAAMTLRFARMDPSGRILAEGIVDERVCDCCPTTATLVPGGALVAYRDRSANEVRDIFVSRFDGSRWDPPRSPHPDGWWVPGCPVNGPAVDAEGARVVLAWFTARGGKAAVRAAFSEDGGASFGPAIDCDEGDPLGRVDSELLPDGSALVLWLEQDEREAALRLRRVSSTSQRGRAWRLTATRAGRASGYPRMIRAGDRVVFAWTDADSVAKVRTAELRLHELP